MRAVQPQVAGGLSMSDGPTALERDVLAYLRQWQGGPATTIEDLRGLAHPPAPRRDVEAAIEALRLRGEPIVGGGDGIHLTSDPDELTKYVAARRRRAVTIYLGTRALRLTAARLREQRDASAGLTLWEAA